MFFLRDFLFHRKACLSHCECSAFLKIKMACSWPKLPILIIYSGVILDLSKEEPADCQFLKGRLVQLLLWRISSAKLKKRGVRERKQHGELEQDTGQLWHLEWVSLPPLSNLQKISKIQWSEEPQEWQEEELRQTCCFFPHNSDRTVVSKGQYGSFSLPVNNSNLFHSEVLLCITFWLSL